MTRPAEPARVNLALAGVDDGKHVPVMRVMERAIASSVETPHDGDSSPLRDTQCRGKPDADSRERSWPQWSTRAARGPPPSCRVPQEAARRGGAGQGSAGDRGEGPGCPGLAACADSASTSVAVSMEERSCGSLPPRGCPAPVGAARVSSARGRSARIDSNFSPHSTTTIRCPA